MPKEIDAQIETLVYEGCDRFNEGKWDESIAVWKQGLALVPEPQTGFGQTAWLAGSIAEAYYNKHEYVQAMEYFEMTRQTFALVGVVDNQSTLRLGQCCLETGDEENAEKFLRVLYKREGKEFFKENGQQYIDFLERRGALE